LSLPRPVYAHVPVLTESDDSKLGKSRRSVSVDPAAALPQLLSVFSMLGLAFPAALAGGSLTEAWDWAIGNWDIKRVPRCLNVRVSD
jgi:glutamyl-Q tRNA(Asp) synthetase